MVSAVDIFEGELRSVVRAWATANSVVLFNENLAPKQVNGPTAILKLDEDDSRRAATLRSTIVRTEGTGIVSILIPLGTGMPALLALIDSLTAAVIDGAFSVAQILSVGHRRVGGQGVSYRCDVVVSWRIEERGGMSGVVGRAVVEQGALNSYRVCRSRWTEKIATPLGIRTFWDNGPNETDAVAATLPIAVASWRTFEPVAAETALWTVGGRLLVALHFPPAVGTSDPRSSVVEAITQAFDGVHIDGVSFGPSSSTRVGFAPSQSWQVNVRLPFTYEVRS